MPAAASSVCKMRYTVRPNRFLRLGARSFPDVELSLGNPVTGHPAMVGASGAAVPGSILTGGTRDSETDRLSRFSGGATGLFAAAMVARRQAMASETLERRRAEAEPAARDELIFIVGTPG